MKKTKFLIRTLCCASVIACHFSSAYANGFRLPEYSSAGVATANALVADASRISAVAYNPAIMSLYNYKDNNNLFSASYINVNYETEVSTSSQTTQGTGQSSFDVPGLFVGTQISEQLSFGLLLHSPFGLETDWPTGTFSAFGGTQSLEPSLSRIKMYNANFNFSYKVASGTAIALGINQYHLLDLRFNTQATEIKGTGTGYGWNAALITQVTPNTTFGLSYRSTVQALATGTAAGVLPIELEVTFPEMLTLGLNIAFTDALNLEFDIEHTGWHVFDKLEINNRTNGANVTTSTNNWKDTLTYRTSAQYQINKHQLLFGYAYDETPQGDSKYSARIPDADRQLFSIGYQYDFGNFQFETGLMLVKFNNRTVNSSTTYVAGSEANGTSAYNGTYRSSATVLSVGINTTF